MVSPQTTTTGTKTPSYREEWTTARVGRFQVQGLAGYLASQMRWLRFCTLSTGTETRTPVVSRPFA